mmetsp:Transcript_158253/g.303682  ORF Transcript_158253/g.303682 Transcript_158253/m.303682 type:complete len:176 (-) Transcript_158253:624-1151(-)
MTSTALSAAVFTEQPGLAAENVEAAGEERAVSRPTQAMLKAEAHSAARSAATSAPLAPLMPTHFSMAPSSIATASGWRSQKARTLVSRSAWDSPDRAVAIRAAATLLNGCCCCCFCASVATGLFSLVWRPAVPTENLPEPPGRPSGVELRDIDDKTRPLHGQKDDDDGVDGNEGG